MQKCSSCGAYFSDFDKACPHCGQMTEAALAEQAAKEETPDTVPETEIPEPEQTAENGEREEGGYTPPFGAQNSKYPYQMKWHHFLMVIMVIGPVLSIIMGFTGILNPYNTTDLVFSILGVCLGLLGLIVRNRLDHYRKGSPTQLLILYAVTAGINMLNSCLAIQASALSEADKAAAMGSTLIGGVIGAAAIILLTRKYYNKRKDLFVN